MFAPRNVYAPQPIDENIGLDWLSKLGRFRQAETGATVAAGREMMVPGQSQMPIFNPDEEQKMRQQALVRLLMER